MQIDGASDWRKWSVLEGLTKTISRVLQKKIGTVSSSYGMTFLAVAIVGLVQMIVGGFWAKHRGIRLLEDREAILGSMAYGLLALIATVCSFLTFLEGGDIGTSTFIVAMSIVPGMFIDIIFFKYKSTFREWFGICVAIAAASLMLGPKYGLDIPIWVLYSLITSLCVATNNGIARKIRKIHPSTQNFWGGGTCFVLASCIIFLFIDKVSIPLPDFQKLMWSSLIIGIVVVFMWSFSLLSYKQGADIALKKLVMNGTYLITAMIIGWMFFGEMMTATKWLSLPLFVLAFVLMDKKVWDYIFK